MTTTQRSAATEGYSVIGSRPVRHDGTDKVTGRAQYGADISLPGMLYGKVLRSPPRPRPHQEHRHQQG